MEETAYTFTRTRSNVHRLTAPYSLLVKAFGRVGTIDPRDDYKSMATWYLKAPDNSEVDVYDYKVGKCYDRKDGLALRDITDWHVQGTDVGIQYMLDMLDQVQA